MSRWVRLNTSYFTDSRTFALRSRYGETALWLVPRLWCFAAENAQDGLLSAYAPAALAEELRFSGDADALFAALRDVGFLDDACRLVDWALVYGLAKARTESAAKAREVLAAKRAARSAACDLNTQDPSRREKRERNIVTGTVTAALKPSLSPPQYCDLTADQRMELTSEFGCESAASAAYGDWRARKLNYGDVFPTQDDAYRAALSEFRRRPGALVVGWAAPISEVPGWHGFLRDRSRLLGQDPDTIPAEWGALTRDQQEVVQGQRARAALFVTRKQEEQ